MKTKGFDDCCNEIAKRHGKRTEYYANKYALYWKEVAKLLAKEAIKLARMQVEKESLITKYGRYTEQEIFEKLKL